jgi:hypothetical protein
MFCPFVSSYILQFSYTIYIQFTDHELIPERMRVLRQCKVPRAEVMFVTIQGENIRPSKKEVIKAVTMTDACS